MAAPCPVGPLEGVVVVRPGRLVDAVRLPGRSRVRQRCLVSAEHERVVRPSRDVEVGVPPTGPLALRHLVIGVVDPQTYALVRWSPEVERHAASLGVVIGATSYE